MQETKIKIDLFCIPKTPSRMIQPSKTMTTYSFVRHQMFSFLITTISTPNHHSQRIVSTSSNILTSKTPIILPPVGKEYMYIMKEGKYDQAAKCIEARIMSKVIDYVLSIDNLEQKCVVIKVMLLSPQLKYYVQTIDIHPFFKQKCYV